MPPPHQSDHIPILPTLEAMKIRMVDVDLRPHLTGPPAVPALPRDMRGYGAVIGRKNCDFLESRCDSCRIDMNLFEAERREQLDKCVDRLYPPNRLGPSIVIVRPE